MESSDTWALATARPSSSRASPGSSTGDTTRQASPSSTAPASWACASAPASSRCCARTSPSTRCADGTTGIGHTRWATHGGPTDTNAHPHLADDDKLAVIHNGIIENFAEIKADLLSDGYTFLSETDTEAAAILLGREYQAAGGDLEAAFRAVVSRLEGAFTLLAMHEDHPGLVVGARRNSPLVIGLGEGENFLGSDVAAFVEHTRNALAIGQDQIVSITPSGVRVTDFTGADVEVEPFEVLWDAAAADKGGWSSFMAKEISEEPEAVNNTILGRVRDGQVVIPELDGLDELLTGISRIIIVACGTAAYAGSVGKYAIEQWARVPVDVELAHEFRYRDPVIGDDTLVVSISQSGETMDTLMAVKYARERGARTLSICNTQGATIPRESDAIVYTHAGPEVAVASTKAFVAQITALYLFGLHLARVRGTHRRRPRARRPCSSSRASPARSAASSTASRAASSSSRTGWPTPARCCSSAATSATPSPWRARSSSRSWRTSTPRGSRRAS